MDTSAEDTHICVVQMVRFIVATALPVDMILMLPHLTHLG